MADTKKEKHKCPEIDKTLWNIKMTGPAFTPGMGAEEARSAWAKWVRMISAAARPMPRKTFRT